jgi:large subunit ribosomal protein L18
MKFRKKLNQKRVRRVNRVRATIKGTAERPRLSVRRTNRYFYAQLIDDVKGHTILSVSSVGTGKEAKANKTAQAFTAGELLGTKAVAKGVKSALFDRRSYKFHGRVKSFADGAKKAGLTI